MNFYKAFHLLRDVDKLINQKSELEKNIQEYLNTKTALESQISSAQSKLSALSQDIDYTRGSIIATELKAYSYPDKKTSSVTLEKELDEINQQITQMVASNAIIQSSIGYVVDGSNYKGSRFQKFYGESLLLSFNNYFDKKAKAITTMNYYKTCELIESNYKKMNKRASIIGDSLSPKYLALKLKSLKLLVDINIQIKEERRRVNEEKKRLREQEQLLLEAEKERKRLEEEKKDMDIAFNKALTEQEREDIKSKIVEIDRRLEDIEYKVNNPKAGWVYLITSPSLPNMYKCGVTRRLSGPMERVRELSSSSLPFAFELKGFCFSGDAFDIENKMHKYFDNVRVAENREFFYGSVEDAIEILRDKFKQEVHSVDFAKENKNNESEED